jgi:hypothetical protein
MKPVKNAHTANMKIGMGNNYGSGIRNPVGKIRSDALGANNLAKKKLGKPPKSLA